MTAATAAASVYKRTERDVSIERLSPGKRRARPLGKAHLRITRLGICAESQIPSPCSSVSGPIEACQFVDHMPEFRKERLLRCVLEPGCGNASERFHFRSDDPFDQVIVQFA